MNRRRAIIEYAKARYWQQLIVGLAIFISLVIIFIAVNALDTYITDGKSWRFWQDLIDPALTVFSIVAPLLIAWYLIDREWEAALESKMMVHFTLNIDEAKRYVMSCYNVNLLPNADMRSLGQQIGGQMSTMLNQLKFNPSIRADKPKIIKIKNEKQDIEWIKYYSIEFLLDEDPCPIAGKYIVWNIFYRDASTQKPDLVFSERPIEPLHEKYNQQITLEDLFSSNIESLKKFKDINP